MTTDQADQMIKLLDGIEWACVFTAVISLINLFMTPWSRK